MAISVGKFLAAGAFGKVHEGEFEGKKVAIKTLPRLDMIREARMMKKCNHINVVKFLASKNIAQGPAIIMELCTMSLADELLVFKNGLHPRKLFRVVENLTDGYRHLRDQNLAHFDLKPANILLGWDYNYKISDFGAAEIVPDGDYTWSFAGTPAYAHPLIFEMFYWEQIHGKKEFRRKKIAPTVDLWSLAVLLYECATGKLPFDAQTEIHFLKIMTIKPYCTIRGFEDADGWFHHYDSMPKSNSDATFLSAMVPLLTTLLQSEEEHTPTFLEFFTGVNALLKYWRFHLKYY